MSVNNPNFPTSQGERRIEESKIQKTVAIGLPSSASVYQIPKTLTRHIAPSPSTQMTATSKPITAVQTLQKKDLQKIPLTSAASITTLSSGTALSNIIPVQIGTTTPAAAPGSALHAPNASNIVRAAHLPGSTHSVAFSHLPRGIVAASAHVRTGTAIAVQKPAMPSSVQTSALSLQSQIRNVLPQMMHLGAIPTTTVKPVTTVSLAGSQATETHRASIPLHVSSVGNTSSIQITLPASRGQGDLHGKGTTMPQTGKVHLNQALNMTAQQPKAIITHAMTPVIQQTLAAKGNRGQPVSQSPVSVTVALSTTTVTIPIISSSSTSTTIPIAKVPPQRQTNLALSGHTLPSTTVPSTTLDHCTEISSFPQPLPAHVHSTSSTQDHSTSNTAHGQSSNSLYMPPYRGTMPIVTPVNSSVGHSEGRTEQTISQMAPFLSPLMSGENPYYHQLMRRQVAAVAQVRQQQALLPSQAAVNMTNLSQAVTEATVVSSIRFNHPLMVLPQSRQSTQLQTVPAQFHANNTVSDGINKVMTSPVPMIMTGLSVTTVPQAASNMHTAVTQSHHTPQIGQPGHAASSATPVTNSNASPRPSILRKRTLNEGSAVKKQLLNSLEVLSPRPDPRVDSTPQSNLSSPKTPASGESQSSTDTALSSEATTPTQAHGDSRVKQEPQENGFGNTPEASPRKRRKQLLQANEELRDTPVSVSVFDRLVEACVKEEITEEYVEEEQEDDDDMDDFDVDDLLSDDEKQDSREEYIDEEGIRWTLEKCRPNLALLNFYNISWKPKNNHFIRYTDVKPKDERRPTINELSNQKGVLQKTSGWKLYHMAAQIEDLVALELELNDKLSGLQAAMGADPQVRHSLMEDESSMLHELTQGNIQRCKLITDQLNDAMTQMLNVLDHKPKISEIISKHMSKRPIKKKERT